MSYVRATGSDIHEYPVSEQVIRERHPSVSFAIPFTPPSGYFQVTATDQPASTQTVKYVENAPSYLDGVYTQAWLSVAKSIEEQTEWVDTLKITIIDAVQTRLDNFARTRNYDGILSACTYATSAVVQFKSDADYCVSARDSTWSALYTILNEVNSATRAMPSGFADIENLLPVLSWPA